MDARQAVRRLRSEFYERLGQDLGPQTIADAVSPLAQQTGSYESTVFDIFPFLFLDLFPGVTQEQALQLAYAGMLYLDYLRLEDAVADRQPVAGQFVHPAVGGLVHEEALATLRALLGNDAVFWPSLRHCHQEYVRALIAEREVQTRRPMTYSRAERDRIAADKCASGKATFTALAALNSAEGPPKALLRSYDAFCVSYQLYDDILDWRQDYVHGPYSYLVVQALQYWQDRHEGKTAEQPRPDEMGQIIYYGRLAEDLLKEAGTYADQAVSLVQDLDCPAWVATLRECQALYTRLADDLAQLKEQGLITRGSERGLTP